MKFPECVSGEGLGHDGRVVVVVARAGLKT